MQSHKVITNFRSVKENDLVEFTQSIISKMTKNPDFPNPVPPLTTLQSALKAYNDALTKSRGGTKQDTDIKNEKKAILEKDLSHLATYVNLTADGNLAKLDGSGFPLSQPHTKIGILQAPDFIHVTDGNNPGEVHIEISKVDKASGYLVLYAQVPAPENNKDWHEKNFSMTKGILINLESGKKYAFKVAAISTEANKLNYYNFSQTSERFIQ